MLRKVPTKLFRNPLKTKEIKVCIWAILLVPFTNPLSGSAPMILTDEAAKARLNSPNNLANRFGRGPNPVTESQPSLEESNEGPAPLPNAIEIRKQTRPGNPGYRLPNEVKTTIAILGRAGVPQRELAKQFGTTQGEVSFIERGKSKGVDESIVDKRLASVHSSALDKLTAAVLGITEDKLANTKAGTLSSIARNLASVVEKTAPRQAIDPNAGPQIIIYAPEIKSEASYKTIEVSGAA